MHFIHTNDLHSHFAQWPHTVAAINGIKSGLEARNEPYLLVDIGDHLDRAHFITEGSAGKANIELMNQVGYDYATIGNNEGLTFSKEMLNNLYQDATFKILVNNLLEQSEYPSWLSPYTIHYCRGMKIGLIGSTVNYTPFYQQLGWQMCDALESIEGHVKLLRDDVDLVVLLSHLGLRNDQLLAERIKGVDLILGAHTHHVLHEGLQVSQTWITQAGKFGEHVGHVTIEWQDLGRPAIFSTCVQVDQQASDIPTEQLVKIWEKKADAQLAQQVAELQEEMHIAWDKESILANVMAEGLRAWCQANVAIVNSGLILDHLSSGPVTKRDLHRICPHPINPCLIKITGKKIYSILQRSLDQELQQLAIKGFGFRGKVLGMLALDGLEVRCTTSGKDEPVIQEILINGEPLEQDQFYDLATIDMFTFSTLFPELHQPEHVHYFLPEFIRDIIRFRLESGSFDSAKLKRWVYL